MSDELKPCWLCGGKGKWDDMGGYCFVKCQSRDCKNSKQGYGVDGHIWQRSGVTEAGGLLLENKRLWARVEMLENFVAGAQIDALRALDPDYVPKEIEMLMKSLFEKCRAITGEDDPEDIEPEA